MPTNPLELRECRESVIHVYHTNRLLSPGGRTSVEVHRAVNIRHQRNIDENNRPFGQRTAQPLDTHVEQGTKRITSVLLPDRLRDGHAKSPWRSQRIFNLSASTGYITSIIMHIMGKDVLTCGTPHKQFLPLYGELPWQHFLLVDAKRPH